MPEIPPLRQVKLWLRSGRPFIPELKSSGFSGRFYKKPLNMKFIG
jgi:hypothetical protein